MSACTGWDVQRQHRDYGRWVRVSINGNDLWLTLDPANPLGLSFGHVTQRKLPLRATRRNADIVGMALAACLDGVAALLGGLPSERS